jgi:hypothetical protein
MAGIELFRSLLQQASAQGSRSTVLNPLGWALAISLSGVLGSVYAHCPPWVTTLFCVFASIVLVFYLASYVYFALTNSDALRSERFTLSKMAIEKNIIGDSLQGFIQLTSEDYQSKPAAIEGTGEND